MDKNVFFTRNLLRWNDQFNRREMPWKGEKDPYKIWLIEIILQQTRVEQGLEYYKKFINKYPVITKLASAPEKEVFKLWEGLGYYSRCKNLITTAKYISESFGGEFPRNHNEILKLKGVGPYTAAAIGSFAFNLPYAVVDGNVTRVLSRFFGITTPIDTALGKKKFNELAQKLLEIKSPGVYNQAIMDFGATVCKPKNPFCENCLLSTHCFAFQKNHIDQLPLKEKKITIKKRYFYYFILSYGGAVLVKKRNDNDIWQNLHEFLLIEKKGMEPLQKLLLSPQVKEKIGSGYSILENSQWMLQKLTHQHIHGIFIHIALNEKIKLPGYQYVSVTKLNQLAFPKLITSYISCNKIVKK